MHQGFLSINDDLVKLWELNKVKEGYITKFFEYIREHFVFNEKLINKCIYDKVSSSYKMECEHYSLYVMKHLSFWVQSTLEKYNKEGEDGIWCTVDVAHMEESFYGKYGFILEFNNEFKIEHINSEYNSCSNTIVHNYKFADEGSTQSQFHEVLNITNTHRLFLTKAQLKKILQKNHFKFKTLRFSNYCN